MTKDKKLERNFSPFDNYTAKKIDTPKARNPESEKKIYP
jgi:hypothetical protein